MSKKELELTIDSDGNLELEAFGYKGKGCAEVIDQMAKAMGKPTKTKQKTEYYQQEDTQIKQKVNRL